MSAVKVPGEPPRETISLLLTSILGGVGLVEAVILLEETVAASTELPIEPIVFFLVYLSIWMRFIPGNVSHIRRLERWPTATINVWLWDVSVITAESLLLVYMAKPSVTDRTQFLASLLILLFLDAIWLVSMIPDAGEKRPTPNYVWLGLNVPSAFLVAFSLFSALYVPELAEKIGPTSFFGTYVIPLIFYLCAVVDIYKTAPDWFGRPREKKIERKERETHEKWMKEAIKEANTSKDEDGIPIGAVLVRRGSLVSSGHNKRVQDNNPMAHAEIECLKNAGRRKDYADMTLYSTLMPCAMCAGAIFQFGIRRVIVGESRNFVGAKACLQGWGVQVVDLDMEECCKMLEAYMEKNQQTWKEDIGRK